MAWWNEQWARCQETYMHLLVLPLVRKTYMHFTLSFTEPEINKNSLGYRRINKLIYLKEK